MLLARLNRRVFTNDETLEAQIEVAHFGAEPIKNGVGTWRLVDEGNQTVLSGRLPLHDMPVDNGITLGNVSVNLKDLASPGCYKLIAGIEGTPFENDWNIWIYPARVDANLQDVSVADSLNENTLLLLEAGGKVLLLIPPAKVNGDKLGSVALGFSTIFWNTAWTHRQAPHTLGILCDPKHPALAMFPTDCHSDWQWWYLVSRASAMILDNLQQSQRPIVQAVDDWFTNRKLGLVFEAKLGSGKLLICSIDLINNTEENPVARQMFHSLLHYMNGDKFQPEVEVTPQQVEQLVCNPELLV